jgi:hypothetical protein
VAAGSGGDLGADAVESWLQRFVGRVAMPRVLELFKWHVSLDFSISSCLPDSHIQHFASKRVKEVGQMHQHAENIRKLDAGNNEPRFQFRYKDLIMGGHMPAVDDLKPLTLQRAQYAW